MSFKSSEYSIQISIYAVSSFCYSVPCSNIWLKPASNLYKNYFPLDPFGFSVVLSSFFCWIMVSHFNISLSISVNVCARNLYRLFFKFSFFLRYSFFCRPYHLNIIEIPKIIAWTFGYLFLYVAVDLPEICTNVTFNLFFSLLLVFLVVSTYW